jgi:hypothetical protein
MISEHKLTVLAIRNGTPVEIKVKSARIQMDEAWSPYIQATITAEAPSGTTYPTEGDYFYLDPFYNTRLQLAVEENFGGSKKVSDLTTQFKNLTLAALSSAYNGKTCSQLTALFFIAWNAAGIISSTRRRFNLKVRSYTLNIASMEVTIDAASDESLLLDYGLVSTVPYEPNLITVKTAVQFALGKIGAQLTEPATDAAIEADQTIWEPGTNAWSYVQPMVEAAGLRLYCDEDRAWRLVPSPVDNAATNTFTYGSDLIDGSQTVSLDGTWYSAAVIEYRWTDPTTNQTLRSYDAYKDDTFPYTRTMRIQLDKKYPGPGGAKTALARQRSASVTQEVTTVNDYTVTPGNIAVADFGAFYSPKSPTSSTDRVKSVRWTWPHPEMVVSIRGQAARAASTGINLNNVTGGAGGIGISNELMGA